MRPRRIWLCPLANISEAEARAWVYWLVAMYPGVGAIRVNWPPDEACDLVLNLYGEESGYGPIMVDEVAKAIAKYTTAFWSDEVWYPQGLNLH